MARAPSRVTVECRAGATSGTHGTKTWWIGWSMSTSLVSNSWVRPHNSGLECANANDANDDSNLLFVSTGKFSVGRPDGLISGIFLDDDISATGGFAENCNLADCEHDMGLTTQDMQDLQAGWADMMNRTQARVLELGGFDWRK